MKPTIIKSNCPKCGAENITEIKPIVVELMFGLTDEETQVCKPIRCFYCGHIFNITVNKENEHHID